MALGIMLSVVFVLAATLTLLPAVLAKLGPKVDALAAAAGCTRGEHRSARFAALGRAALAPPARLRRPPRRSSSSLLALPVLGLKTGMPSIKVVPTGDSSRVGYTQVQQAFGAGAPGALQIVAPQREAAARRGRRAARPRHRPRLAAAARRRRPRARAGDPDDRPVEPGRRRARSTGSAPRCRPARSSAAPPPRTTTSSTRSRPRRRS